MTEKDIQIAVAKLFGYRKFLMIPNASWGMAFNYEIDLLIMDQKNRLTDVEIKISRQDLLKDFEKKHWHDDPRIGRLVYAVPQSLLMDTVDVLQQKQVYDQVGIISCSDSGSGYAVWEKIIKYRIDAQPLTDKEIIKAYQLCSMRFWSDRIKYHKTEKMLKTQTPSQEYVTLSEMIKRLAYLRREYKAFRMSTTLAEIRKVQSRIDQYVKKKDAAFNSMQINIF